MNRQTISLLALLAFFAAAAPSFGILAASPEPTPVPTATPVPSPVACVNGQHQVTYFYGDSNEPADSCSECQEETDPGAEEAVVPLY